MSLLVTQLFLERSAPLPVSVSPYSLIPPHLLPLMVSVVNRWRNFELLYHEDLPIEFVSALQMPPRNLKSLEKLYLTWPNPGSGVDTFKLTPCLRDVTLKGCWASSCIPLLPWSQFTRLSLEHESPQMCLDVIVQCTNLVSAHVVTDQWLEVPRIGETCVLEYVEKLEISMEICYEGQDLAPFLRALELPALKSLSLFIPFSRPPCSTVSFVPELILFLVQSPRLECLGLLDCVFAEDIQDILQHTPSLSELLFDQEYTASVGDDFFLALVYDAAAAAPLAQKLETLKLHNIGVDFTEEAFAQMIGSRWWSDDELNTMLIPPSVARLKRVNLNNDHFYPKYFTETFIEKMELYRSQGLNISY
ncbi:hypothetical protein B0H14DRAFT_400862 [Mycena olivaceomarginata]|nr:hypothetical protein B0H14DRAFT_400862 [Mycena olivaceomarginata]